MTTEQVTRTFLGVPLEGDIRSSGRRTVAQLPIEDIAPLLQAVLEDENIKEFGWNQYTPYFNDGEPCVFRTGEMWFLTVADAEDPEDQKLREEDIYSWQEEHGFYNRKRGLAKTITRYDWSVSPAKQEELPNRNYLEGTSEKCEALVKAFSSGHYETAFLAKFGDHADVTISSSKIVVEEYSHE